MRSSRTMLVLYTLTLVGCIALTVNAQNTTTTAPEPATTKPVGSGDGDDSNLALDPLYKMTNTFIRVVFPDGIRVDTIRELLDAVEKNQIEPWPLTQTVLNGYYGFATCVVVGVLFIVLMPFIGCFCCCCRLCNKCGGKTQEQDPKNAKCKRIFCAGLLLVFTLITVGGMVMVFFSASRLHQLVDDKIVDNQLQAELSSFNQTIRSTISEGVVGKTSDILEELNATVTVFLDDASNKLTGSFLNLSKVEQPVTELAIVIDNVNQTLDSLIESLTKFEILRNETALDYTTAQQLLNESSNAALLSGVTVQFQQLVDTINSFSVANVAEELNTGAKAQLKTIPNLRERYKMVNDTISNLIESKLNTSKADIQKTVQVATGQIRNQVDTLAVNILKSLDGVTSEGDIVSQTLGNSVDYVKYGWYACIAFGAILAFISLLYLCGLMCGCGDRPGPDANTCNKGCGAKFLLAAVGFTFIFYSLLMLMTVIMFALGSLVSSHVCWTIQSPNSTVTALQTNNIALPGSNLTLQTIIKSYSDCLDGQPIGGVVDALNLGFGKETILKELRSQLGTDKLNGIIKGVNIDAGAFDILPTDFNDTLKELNDFDGFNSSIVPDLDADVNITKVRLNVLIGLLDAISIAGPDAKLQNASGILTRSRDTGIDKLVSSADDIRGKVDQMNTHLALLKNASNNAFSAITVAQEYIKTNGTELVQQVLGELVNSFAKTVTADATNGVNKIFGQKCDKLANNLKSTVNVVCETVFNPWNGLWFSLGWSLIMLIPCIVIAVVLTSLFRRTESYDGDYKEDLNRDYDGGERIPLESRTPDHHGDTSNRGFRDDYGRAMYNGGGRDMYPNEGGRVDRYGDQGYRSSKPAGYQDQGPSRNYR